MVRTAGSPAPPIAPAPIGAFPEPIAFPEADDLGTTRAIPTLAKPRPAAAAVPEALPPPVEMTGATAHPIAIPGATAKPLAIPDATAEPLAIPDATAEPLAIAPFAIDGEERAAAEPPAQKSRRDDEIVFETSPPFAETPGVTEDTNPAFFARRPPAASEPIEFSAPDEHARTAGFTVAATFDEAAPPEEPEALPAAEEAALPPETASGEGPRTAAASGTSSPSPETAPAPVASPFEARMIQLAVVSAWGDRISAAEEKLARWEALEERLAGAEKRIAEGAALPERLGALEGRLGRVEGARGWAKDVDLLRTDWANARLASEGQTGDLRRAISDLQQSLAEGSGREMELVAQVSRQALGAAAAIEKLGFRIQETEEKFSQLVVDQESRLGRLERLVDEMSARTTSDRESARQAVLELEERFRALRDEETESRRRAAAELDESVRQAREEFGRRQASADDLRRRLADSLADLARRFGDDPPA